MGDPRGEGKAPDALGQTDLSSAHTVPSDGRVEGRQEIENARTEAGPVPGVQSEVRPGDILGERYRILEVLGQGGEGVVLRALDLRADTVVALKLLLQQSGDDPRLRRLRRELRMARKVTHPGVVRIYDLVELPGRFGLSMELVEGTPLDSKLAGGKRLPRAELFPLALDLARALGAAHTAGVTHRDLKPANILLRASTGRAVVTDFGISRLHEHRSQSQRPPPMKTDGSVVKLTQEGALVGTPLYMSPEQLRGSVQIGPPTDIYAFGLVLFEAATGQLPHRSDTLQGLLAERLSTPVEPLSSLRPDLPLPFCRIINRCLGTSPEARFKNGGELRAALDDAANAGRKRWKMAGVAAGVACLLGVTALSLARGRSHQPTMCHAGAERAAGAWGPVAREKVGAAFMGTKLAYADLALSGVARALDSYSSAWAGMADDSCAATHIRGDQSDAVLDLRDACLSSRLREVQALVEVFEHADVNTVNEASHAVQSLSSLDACADVAALRATSPVPRDRDAAGKVEVIERRLATAKASYDVGKESEAIALADDARRDASDVGFVPLLARTDLLRGLVLADLGDSGKTLEAFHAAFAEALASHEDTVLRDAAARLAQEYIYARQPTEFDHWANLTQVALDRGQGDPKVQAFLDHIRCIALWGRGLILTRFTCLEKNAAKVERARPLNEWELTTIGLAAMDVAQFARGVTYARAGYEYSLSTRGELHPRTLEMRRFLAQALEEYGDLAAAQQEATATLKRAGESARENEETIARVYLILAAAARDAGDFVEAHRQLESAREARPDDDDVKAALAQLEVAAGHADQAVPHLRDVLADLSKQLPPKHPDVLEAKANLASALLKSHQAAEARTLLDEVIEAGADAELSPVTRAYTEFASARASWTDPGRDGAAVLAMAETARDRLKAAAPQTKPYADRVTEITAWLDGARSGRIARRA